MMYRRTSLSFLSLAALATVAISACKGETTSSTGDPGAPNATGRDVPATTERGRLVFDRARDAFPALTTPEVDRFVESLDGKVTARVDAPRFHDPMVLVHTPTTAAGTLDVESRGLRVSVTPRALADVKVEWAERMAVYPDVQEGVHAFRRVAWDGVEDFYQVEKPRAVLEFSYDLALGDVAGLRLVDRTLELLDAGGAPRIRATTPVVIDRDGVRRAGEILVSGCAYDTSGQGPWGRPVTAPGASSCVVTMRIDGRGLSYPVLVDPAWIGTYNTKQTSAYHRLFNLTAGRDAGKVLLVGGTGSGPTSTELFDSVTNTWATSDTIGTDSLGFGQGSASVMLGDGTVVLSGGFPLSGTTTVARASVMVRKPNGSWIVGAAMSGGRAFHTLTAVKDGGGKDFVLAAGGQPQSTLSTTAAYLPLKTAEVYDVALDAWKGAGAMSLTRTHAAATTLADGRVAVIGGDTQSTTCCTYVVATTSVDIFNPATTTWSAGPALKTARAFPVAISLATGSNSIVVAGGYNSTSYTLNSLETLDSAATAWTALTSTLTSPRQMFTGERLPDGRVLFIGGNTIASTSGATPTDTTDLYDPVGGSVVGSALMATPRQNHASVVLPGRGVLATGGLTTGTLGSETTISEIYDTTIGKTCGTTAACGATSGLTCIDGVCCTSGSCPEGQTCAAPGHEGICAKPKGSTCGTNGECATGFCVSGFCCESACTGGCKSCATKGTEGTCVLADPGTDPAGFCAAGATDLACARKCDATGKCGGYAPAGTTCGKALVDGGTPFCTTYSCSGFGYCNTTPYNCGLTCTTSVTCTEASRTCTPSSSGVKPGFCVIEGTCWTYGDVDPKDPCKYCDPPTSKIDWSTTTACTDGGVADTGSDAGADARDTGVADTGPKDTGTTADTGSAPDTGVVDTGTSADTNVDDTGSGASDLPTSSACGCHVPGDDHDEAPLGMLALALGALAIGLRRRAR